MNFTPADVEPVTNSYGSATGIPDINAELTPEEIRILRECNKEGITKRAIPLAIASAVCGMVAGNSGPLNHKKFGAKPAALAFGIIGYFVGRLSYSKVCLQRVLQVPDGTIRKMYAEKGGNLLSEVDPSIQYYAPTETPKGQDTLWDTAMPSSDIDVASTSSFDTVPSDYYQNQSNNPIDQTQSQNFTSYDDLRKQNREEFSNRFRVQPQQPPSQQRQPQPRRLDPQDSQPVEFGKQRTKYGDTWE